MTLAACGGHTLTSFTHQGAGGHGSDTSGRQIIIVTSAPWSTMAQMSRKDDAIVLAYLAKEAAPFRLVEVRDILPEAVDRGSC